MNSKLNLVQIWLNQARHVKRLALNRYLPPYTDHQIEPVFIIGSGRSGNTLLRRLLTSCADIHIPPETYRIPRMIKYYQCNATEVWGMFVPAFYSQIAFMDEFDTFSMNMTPVVNRALQLNSSERSIQTLFHLFYVEHARQHGDSCSRWGDKTPINTLHLDLITSVFPKAYYVHILRDGADAIASYYRSGLILDIEKAANRWKKSVESAESLCGTHHRLIRVRYEEMVVNPEAVIADLAVELGLERKSNDINTVDDTFVASDVVKHKHHMSALTPVNTDSIGKGRKSLTRDERQSVGYIVNDVLEKYGYEKL